MKKIIILLLLILSANLYSQWTQIAVPTTSGLNNVFFIDENVGYLVGGGDVYGYSNETDGIIFKTSDGGISWTSLYTQNHFSFNYVFVINDTISVYGRNSQQQPILLQSIDDGVNWTETLTNHDIDFMAFSDDNIYYLDFNGSYNLLKRKNNNGVTQTISNDAVLFGVNNNEIIYINNQFDSLFKSEDYGESFVQLTGLPPGFGQNQSTFAKIKSFGNTILIHYTYPNFVAYSLDNGDNWTENMDDHSAIITTIVNANKIYALAPDGINSHILINTNYKNWIEQYEYDNGSGSMRKIYFYNDSLGFAIGENGTMYRTENGGLSTNNTEFLEKKIKVFPNPVKNSIKIEFTDIKIKKIELIDINGKLIKSFSSNFNELKICTISKGSYILKIDTEKGVLNKTILVE